ncbi:tRNA pseudouridine synthase [Trichinella spiralis]|uniref:tRNA pseudouridine synthase n=1 Tax=Trichinella spiralis TaxID=6334 RepID=A0ABR3KA00_TRISP
MWAVTNLTTILCSKRSMINNRQQLGTMPTGDELPTDTSSIVHELFQPTAPCQQQATACDSGASSSIITEIMQTPSVENSMMCQSTIGYICQNVPKRANLWWRRHGRCGANSKITWDNICIKSEQPSLVSRIATYYEASIQIGASEDVDVTVMIVALTHKNPIPKTRRLPFTLPYVFQIAEDIECRLLLNLNQGDRNYEEEEEDDNDDDEEVDENEESVQNMRIPCTVYILPKSSGNLLLMTQLITVFKYLQSIGVEYATKEIEELVLLKIDSEDKPRLILEWDFVSIEERLFKDWQVEKCSLCKVASRILLAVIRTVSGMTCEDADEKRKNLNCVIDHAILKAAHVLIEEKADSLTRALCLMQYIVWVLPEKSLKPLLCEEQANEWIQSERTRLLCHLVKKLLNPLYEINVYDHYCLLFLLNASPKYLLYAEKLICETN